MGVMDGGEIKLVENKVIKIEVVAKLHHHKKGGTWGQGPDRGRESGCKVYI